MDQTNWSYTMLWSRINIQRSISTEFAKVGFTKNSNHPAYLISVTACRLAFHHYSFHILPISFPFSQFIFLFVCHSICGVFFLQIYRLISSFILRFIYYCTSEPFHTVTYQSSSYCRPFKRIKISSCLVKL